MRKGTSGGVSEWSVLVSNSNSTKHAGHHLFIIHCIVLHSRIVMAMSTNLQQLTDNNGK